MKFPFLGGILIYKKVSDWRPSILKSLEQFNRKLKNSSLMELTTICYEREVNLLALISVIQKIKPGKKRKCDCLTLKAMNPLLRKLMKGLELIMCSSVVIFYKWREKVE